MAKRRRPSESGDQNDDDIMAEIDALNDLLGDEIGTSDPDLLEAPEDRTGGPGEP